MSEGFALCARSLQSLLGTTLKLRSFMSIENINEKGDGFTMFSNTAL